MNDNTSAAKHDTENRLIINSTYLKQIWPYQPTTHRDQKSGHFFIPIYEFPEVLERALSENWNLIDVMTNNQYEQFLEVNADFDNNCIKLCYADGTFTWMSVKEWWDNQKTYSKGDIKEIVLKPYYYSGEFRNDMIAGQLRFMRIDMPVITDPDGTKFTPKFDKPSETKSNQVTPRQLRAVVEALGLSPKEAIELLLKEL